MAIDAEVTRSCRSVGHAKVSTGVELEYETFGLPGDPALLLVNGFTAQLIGWESGLCQQLADRGRFVIRYDNRDCGLSTRLDGVPAPTFAELMAARKSGAPVPPVPYSLSDFAADGVALLDVLGIDTAHVAGRSMGGMIVQTMAINHASRVASLISIMSTTGETHYGRATKSANAALLRVPPSDREEYIAQTVEARRTYGSPRYFDAADVADRAAHEFDRAYYPQGAARQLAAIMTAPDRVEALSRLRVPTLVIHGRADTAIGVSGGERTAELIPGATLLVLNDMGHDIPTPLWPIVVDAMISHTTHLI